MDSNADVSPENVVPWRLAISSMSLGRGQAGHALEDRLDMASKYGYQGIEIFFDDVEVVARSLTEEGKNITNGGAKALPDESLLLQAAALIGDMCSQRKLSVICLQPFRNFEGLIDNGSRQTRVEELKLWCRLSGLLDTDLILIPSNFLPANLLSNNVPADLIADLRMAAIVAAEAHPPVRLCYEALAWGTHIDTWEQSWEIVCQANCSNLGICLDTFNIAARIHADPSQETHDKNDAINKAGLNEALLQSMDRLVAAVDVVGKDKVFLVQIADAEALSQPLVPGHPLYDAEQPARMSWSRNCRLFYSEAERGGCLPIQTIAWYIMCKMGYTGWVSFEVFHQHLSDPDPGVPDEMARRGAESWAKLVKDMKDVCGNPGPERPRRCADVLRLWRGLLNRVSLLWGM